MAHVLLTIPQSLNNSAHVARRDENASLTLAGTKQTAVVVRLSAYPGVRLGSAAWRRMIGATSTVVPT